MLGKEKQHKLAVMNIEGKSQNAIADELGVSQPTVSRELQREEVKAIIEKIGREIQDRVLPVAVDNMEHAVTSYKTTKDTQLKEHGYRFSEMVLKGNGLLPSAVTSIFIKDSFNQSNTIIDPIIAEMLRSQMSEIKALGNINDIEGSIEN